MTEDRWLGLRPFSWLIILTCFGGCTASRPVALEQIEVMRTQARAQGSVVDVYPLNAPASQAELEQIRQLEASGRPRQALARADASAEMRPRDPLIWQYVAELALQTGAFSRSLAAADKAADLGPGRGSLCVRTWQTMQLAHRALGDDSAADAAAARAGDCTLSRQPRL